MNLQQDGSALSTFKKILRRGFSLVCYLGVFALIAAIVAVAIDKPINYGSKAQMSEGYALSEPLIEAVNSYYSQHGQFPDSFEALGLPNQEPFSGTYTATVRIGVGGIITVVYGNKVRPKYQGATVVFRPNIIHDDAKKITWDCSGGTVPKTFRSEQRLPNVCR